MRCPHCSISIHDNLQVYPLFVSRGDTEGVTLSGWVIRGMECPSCFKPILYLDQGKPYHDKMHGFSGLDSYDDPNEWHDEEWQELVWPRHSNPRLIAPEVPADIASDYQEADKVLFASPKASAALSRRCLERVLHEAGGAKSKELTKAIDEVVSVNNLPTALGQELQATKEIGNFAAHPRKDSNTSQIFNVEPGEAEWMLDVLESIFDYFYVKPADSKRRIASLNQKLVKAGKRPIT